MKHLIFLFILSISFNSWASESEKRKDEIVFAENSEQSDGWGARFFVATFATIWSKLVPISIGVEKNSNTGEFSAWMGTIASCLSLVWSPMYTDNFIKGVANGLANYLIVLSGGMIGLMVF